MRAAILCVLMLGLGSMGQAQTFAPMGPAQGSVSVSPVLINLASGERATITVRNDTKRAVFYQVSVLRWTQDKGQDRHDSTDDFIASPPQFTLAAGSSQTIRMGFRQPTPAPHERAYRLLLTEVPQAAKGHGSEGQIQFAMQYAIPVFVTGTAPTAPKPLVWQMQQQGNTMHVRADNPSHTRAVVNAVGLIPASSPELAPQHHQAHRATVLAHAWREWRIPMASADPPNADASATNLATNSASSPSAPDWRIVVKAADSAVWRAVAAANMRVLERQ